MTIPATNRQVPDHAILDHFNKQTYLGNRFTFPLTFTLSGTGENKAFYLANPAPTGTTGAFPNQPSLFVDMISLTGLTASAKDTLRVYLNPTGVSGGTAKTPINLRTGSSNASVAALKSAPTATVGTLVDLISAPALATAYTKQLIIVDPGNSILITLQGADTDSVESALGWYEI